MSINVRILGLVFAIAVFSLDAVALEVEEIRRVSVASDGTEGDPLSAVVDENRIFVGSPSISSNGEFVAFESDYDNLVPGDTNGAIDAFVHILATGETRRVNISTGGAEAEATRLVDGPPTAVSDLGEVAFSTAAGNLVPNDTNGFSDVFVHSLQSGVTERVSVTSDGAEIPTTEVGRQERAAAISVGSISPDGRFVVFNSGPDGVVPGDEMSLFDAYVHDRVSGEISVASVDQDGNFLVGGRIRGGRITPDGRYVAFTGVLSVRDVYVKDRATGDLWLVSVNSDGEFHNAPDRGADPPDISDDGRYVVFSSPATNLIPDDQNGKNDVFLRDRLLEETTRVIEDADSPRISGDGRFIAARWNACNPTQIVVHDRVTGETIWASVAENGHLGSGESADVAISADGRFVAFHSQASNLIAGDTNGTRDVFVATLGGGNGSRGSFIDPTDTDGDGVGDGCDGDDDNDQMPDSFENFHGFDPLDASDAGHDSDGDGLTNLEEFLDRTDPTSVDTDSDSAPDNVDNCPRDANADQLDTDGDGEGDACDNDPFNPPAGGNDPPDDGTDPPAGGDDPFVGNQLTSSGGGGGVGLDLIGLGLLLGIRCWRLRRRVLA